MTIKSTQVQQVPPIEAIFFRDFKASHIPEILEEIYMKKIYYPFFAGKHDLTIIDAGQNIGLFSYFAKDYAKRIIGIEPSKMHRETCQKMLDFNGIKNVEILPYALSNKAEMKKLYLPDNNNTAFSLHNFPKNYPSIEVEAITLDDVFKLGKIDGKVDIFKCDIEGEEAKVFASDSFKRNIDKFPIILGEWHDWCGVGQNQFVNMFRDYGYQFNWFPNTIAATFSAVKI